MTLSSITVPDAEVWSSFIERIKDGIRACLAYDQEHPMIVTYGQVVKTFLKEEGCWLEDISSRWVGDSRSPIKVTYQEENWEAELI